MRDDLDRILISEEEINAKVKELAAVLDKDYEGKNPIVLCILKGSIPFFADLIKNMTIPLEIDCISISSYGNKTTSGEVRLIKDIDRTIAGRHILIIEDIIDSGHTLFYLKNLLAQRGPASIKICTLLDKFERRETNIEVDYKAFDIGDYFVVGYGLDYAEKYRNLPYVGILSPKIYS
ncbi:MAG: hypoxanthine phosphoribosyltransferase [Clostridia bacterium]|nr:hypoxanthine phosphoribosyltransferase [Clostridia bacterium]